MSFRQQEAPEGFLGNTLEFRSEPELQPQHLRWLSWFLTAGALAREPFQGRQNYIYMLR